MPKPSILDGMRFSNLPTDDAKADTPVGASALVKEESAMVSPGPVGRLNRRVKDRTVLRSRSNTHLQRGGEDNASPRMNMKSAIANQNGGDERPDPWS